MLEVGGGGVEVRGVGGPKLGKMCEDYQFFLKSVAPKEHVNMSTCELYNHLKCDI